MAEDITRLGAAARQLLNDPVLNLAFELVEDEFAEQWKQTPLGAAEAREKLYHLQAVVKEARARLEHFIFDARCHEVGGPGGGPVRQNVRVEVVGESMDDRP